MSQMLRRAFVFASLVGLACGGGGDSATPSSPSTPSAPSVPAATATIAVDRAEVARGAPVVVTWSSTNATACTATGVWSGSKAPSGSETIALTADGNVGISCPNSAGAAATASAPVALLKSMFNLPKGTQKWRPNPGDIDGDGVEEILMTTMNDLYSLTPPTPVAILGFANGKLVDRTAQLFSGPIPGAFSGEMHLADLDGDGRKDLYICDRGRQINGPLTWGANVTVNGQDASQNQVWLQGADGKFTDATAKYPATIQDSWGCSLGALDNSGKASIVVNTWWTTPTMEAAYIVQWNGTRFAVTRNLTQGIQLWGWSQVADFDKNGYGDIAGNGTIRWGNASGGTNKTLAPAAIETQGFPFLRHTIVGDFNGDGYPDMVRLSGTTPSTGGGSARFALFTGGPNETLVEKVGAFPAVSTYNPSDFGVELAAVDVNFDGLLDITTFGHVYQFNSVDRVPNAIWINKGDGTFKLMHFSDELEGSFNCTSLKYFEAYFTRTTDPKAYNLTMVGCMDSNAPNYISRRVTPAHPITLAP